MGRKANKILAQDTHGHSLIFHSVDEAATFFDLKQKQVYDAIKRGNMLMGYFFDILFE